MKQIKLEVGKTYRSRKGEVVRIVDKINPYGYHYQGSNGKWYTESGGFSYSTETPYDLIEEVEEASYAFITPLLTDKEIEEYIWEEIPISLSQIDIDTHSDGYIRYLNAVHWAKWGRDNCNGL